MAGNKNSKGFDVIVTHRPLSSNAVGGVAIALESLVEDHTTVYAVDSQSPYDQEELYAEEKLNGGSRQIKVLVPEWAWAANYEYLANGVLWPANHDLLNLIESENLSRLVNGSRGNDEVIRRMKEAMSRFSSGHDSLKVLVNDYQITGVGKGVYFHHTPFFSPDTFDKAGEMENGKLIQGILKKHVQQLTSYDAVGVQTPRDLNNLEILMDYLFKDARVSADGDFLAVEYDRGHVTRMKAVPIGTDPDGIEKSLQDSRESLNYVLKNSGRTFSEMFEEDRQKGRYVISRVGRADYTKAHPENMDFIYYFARSCAEDSDPKLFRAYVVAAETRPNVPVYQAEMQRIRSKAGEVNARWREKGYDYDLIELVTEELPQKTGLALMKNSDVYVDVSARDGMHLTPQESIIANGVNGGFVICGVESGTGYLLRRAGFDGGAHGLFVVDKPSRVDAEIAAVLYKKGHRISGELVNHLKNNTVHNWSRNLQELASVNGDYGNLR